MGGERACASSRLPCQVLQLVDSEHDHLRAITERDGPDVVWEHDGAYAGVRLISRATRTYSC